MQLEEFILKTHFQVPSSKTHSLERIIMKSFIAQLCTISFIFIFFFFTSILTTTIAQTTNFKCTTPRATCESLIDYIPINSTTFSDIKTLFGIKNLRELFGANYLPLTTSPNGTVAPKQRIKIPFPCICNNGTGISNKRPIYTVKSGDGLDFIARSIFSNLLTYQQIATVNNIKDVNLIEVGQKLVIPLPCSCDDVDGMKVVHYGHVVASGSTVELIANQYDTTEATLLKLNGLASPNDLKADSVLDVPLKVCTSAISATSPDYPLLVPNGTYTFTANNCVQCNCDKSSNWTLQCQPSPSGVKIANWTQCPSMQCQGNPNLFIGNTSSSNCGPRCSYAGYNSQVILTTPVSSTCPTTDGARPSNGATKIGLGWLSGIWLLISLELGLLGFGLL
ncbi:hypothetical protein AQUCO_01500430v1 [Aquilegia coerulea]|uniref:LysM domain-containing protein n=1 Tax=Aquilegia coerulea TaxID=218851 RepID=A0A2G5DTP6_AQUCA|nr:hypothetical protein AQUCO_01500430v1 [Aquilegia coerulea]